MLFIESPDFDQIVSKLLFWENDLTFSASLKNEVRIGMRNDGAFLVIPFQQIYWIHLGNVIVMYILKSFSI